MRSKTKCGAISLRTTSVYISTIPIHMVFLGSTLGLSPGTPWDYMSSGNPCVDLGVVLRDPWGY